MQCPVCDNPSRRLFEKDGYWICECESCTHRCVEYNPDVQHVDQVYGDGYFTEGGAGYSDYLAEADLITAHGKRYGQLLKRYTSPGKVLDIGAAAGFIMKGLRESGWQPTGLEPNASMAAYGQAQLGLDIRVGSLEHFASDEPYDLVTMVQVLPHFYDLRQALRAAAAITRPGGYWLIETWNKDSLMAHLLGKSWHEYSPPSVLHFFSPTTLGQLVAQFGFEEIGRGRPAKKLNGGHAKSLLQYKLESSALGRPVAKVVGLLPDNLVLPYPGFDIFWGLYQKTKS
jgi:SAM-dependent methyltransferase